MELILNYQPRLSVGEQCVFLKKSTERRTFRPLPQIKMSFDVLPAVQRGHEDEWEYKEEDCGHDHHYEGYLGLGHVLSDKNSENNYSICSMH